MPSPNPYYGMLGGGAVPQRGMAPGLPLFLGLGLLANNQARPWNQGPPSMGAGFAQGIGNYLDYQQQAAEQQAQARAQAAKDAHDAQLFNLQLREAQAKQAERQKAAAYSKAFGEKYPETAGMSPAMQLEYLKQISPAKGLTDDIKEYEFAKSQGYAGTFSQYQKEMKASGKPSVSVTIGGRSPLTKTNLSAVQKEVIGAETRIKNLDDIKNNYRDTYLTTPGKTRLWFANQKAKFGQESAEDRAFIKGATKFRTEVEQEFNQYRRDITGAAASVLELNQLRQAMFNVEMSPPEFEAAFEDYSMRIERMMTAKKELLAKGIDLQTPEGGQILDQVYYSGRPVSDFDLSGVEDTGTLSDDQLNELEQELEGQ